MLILQLPQCKVPKRLCPNQNCRKSEVRQILCA